MADFHASTKPLSRSAGRSAVAAMSYRTGTVLVDERTGLVHDYTRRKGVEHVAAEVVVPRGCRTFTRQALWNAAERAEQRKDARTAREWEVALPCELSKEQRIELVEGFAQELTKRYHTAVDYALHEPSSRGDQRNYHAHVMMATRELRDGRLQDKTLLEWNDKKLAAEGHPVGRKQVEEIRSLWAELSNQALERAGSDERVDHRSLKVQQAEVLKEAEQLRTDGKEMEAQLAELKAMELERTPQTHVGWQATAMEHDGKAVERTEMRLAVQEVREERRRLVAQLKQKIEQLWAQTKTALQELIHPDAQPKEAEKSEAAVEPKPVAAQETKQQEAAPLPIVGTPPAASAGPTDFDGYVRDNYERLKEGKEAMAVYRELRSLGADERTARRAVVNGIVEVNTQTGRKPAEIEKWCKKVAPYNVPPFYNTDSLQSKIKKAFVRNGRGHEYKKPNVRELGR